MEGEMMTEYKELKTGMIVKVESGKNFPATGAKLLLKPRPPGLVTEVKTD